MSFQISFTAGVRDDKDIEHPEPGAHQWYLHQSTRMREQQDAELQEQLLNHVSVSACVCAFLSVSWKAS
jgi:hypothetical protein